MWPCSVIETQMALFPENEPGVSPLSILSWYDLFIPAEISSLAKSKHVILANASVEVLWGSYTQFGIRSSWFDGCRLPLRTSRTDSGYPKLLHADQSGHWAYLVYTLVFMAILLLYAMQNARTPEILACLYSSHQAWTVQGFLHPLVEKCSQERTFSAWIGLFA